MQRPYFNSSIEDLERLMGGADSEALEAVFAELGHRKTDRAAALRRRIEAILCSMRQPPSMPSQAAGQSAGEPSTRRAAAPVRAPSGAPPGASADPVRAASSTPSATQSGRRYAGRPGDILSAWTALEVLSPQTFRKPADLAEGNDRLIARLDGRALPWEGTGEKARPKTQVFYHVMLGAVRMDGATAALLSAFGDKHQDRQPGRGFAAVATITVDRAGRPVEVPAAALSSFAWGLPIALARDLAALGRWPEVEPRLVEALDRRVRQTDEDGNPLPLDAETIGRAFDWLVAELGLPRPMVERPSFALRVHHYWRAAEPPEPPLLGSFFLGDLAAARRLVAGGRAPANLRRYLGIDRPAERKDVLRDTRLIADAVVPGLIPPGRWPAPGRHPLVLLQQAAVDLAAAGSPETGLLPVNGPPGTGKTTLLRDLVAALVVRRAEAMCAFDDPEEAFARSGETLKAGNASVHIHRLDPRLRGFEMLVASSNNKAVENVSRELPSLDAIAADATDLRHFKTVSDNAAGSRGTWGLAAAVLGNAANRYAFRQAAWLDQDRGLRAYLAEAAGTPQWVEEHDEATGKVVRRRKPEVVVREGPPKDRAAALERWRSSRSAFLAALGEVRSHLADIEAARRDEEALAGLHAAAEAAERRAGGAAQALSRAERGLAEATEAEAGLAHEKASAAAALDEHDRRRPGLFSRLFGTAAARDWARTRSALEATRSRATRDHAAAFDLVAATREERQRASQTHAAAAAERESAAAALERASGRCAAMRARCGKRAVDAAFFGRGHERVHLAAPWLDDAAHRSRDRVFALAMSLHKAFADAAAKPLRHNLEALMRAFFGRAAWSPKMRPHMADLWASLFLVVPVVSTTFASVERMLGYLEPEALGWLLVDEAGQAVPQAVVGAMTRTRRAIVVGDPLQVEPVTGLPTELAETICREFAVDPERWNAPASSVQTVADAASTLGAEFEREAGSIRVGWPLLVHRRCADPQFSLSNAIAYGGLMVHATPPRASAIRDVLGRSRWFDVPGGRTEDKWCEAEGDVVVGLLARLASAGVPELDLYVVSPFVIVAQKTRERLLASGLLGRWTDDPRRWTRERVGTVHTVQGREADSVILMLGAPLPTQSGARGWAGGTANLLNVAATRAKENLYVVGARSAWREAGVFRHLAAALSAEAVDEVVSERAGT